MFSELIDVKEQKLFNIDVEILTILLQDHTTKKNIKWATDNYKNHGPGYYNYDYILVERITGYMKNIIKPRTKKTKSEREIRIKEKAEVFTPSWMCNLQNNKIDEEWFGYKNVFNQSNGEKWETTKEKIKFINGKKWNDYIQENRLEISCGEAPYLVSRYDTVTGDIIEINDRIGLLDRKMRVINENVEDEEFWFESVIQAYKSIYGFEWQGDSLLIARENLLYTFTDNYKHKFGKKPTLNMVKNIAEIISWNIFQMDGIKFVIPNSCTSTKRIEYTIFGEEIVGVDCVGCLKNNEHKHNGIYSKVMNWETNRPIKFITLFDRSKNNE